MEFTKEREQKLFQLGVFEICQRLHFSYSGGSNPLPHQEKQEYISYLEKRLKEWTPEHYAWDSAVRMLIVIALMEAKTQ